jgi:hypothetical protein
MPIVFLLDGTPNNPTVWLVAVVVILTIIYAVLRPLRKKDPLMKPPQFASLSRQRSVEREMQNVLVELSEMTRQVSAQLDTRATKLEMLIKDADQRIATLKALSGLGTGSQEFAYPEPVEAPPVEKKRLSDPVPEVVEQSVEPPSPPDPRYAEIYAMADEGRSSQEIAQQLNRPSGEVELILALRGG